MYLDTAKNYIHRLSFFLVLILCVGFMLSSPDAAFAAWALLFSAILRPLL